MRFIFIIAYFHDAYVSVQKINTYLQIKNDKCTY